MRILVLTQYFPPETGAAQQRLFDLSRQLHSFGHEVTVMTSMPNYPQGKIFEKYRKHFFIEEKKDGIRILRTWAWVSASRSFFSRLLNYLSFALLAIWTGIRHARKQDVIVVESPPLFLGITGIVLGRLGGAVTIFNVSDLWPQSAVSMGILKNPLLIRIAVALENYIYKNSYAITGQTEGIVQNIRGRVAAIPVELITNGVDSGRFLTSLDDREEIRANFDFSNYFVIGYAGLHGLAQGLDTVLEVAKQIRRDERVVIAFFGDGPEKKRLQNLAIQEKLTNVRFFPPQPAEIMPKVLSSLDAAIVPLKNLPLFQGALPSKLFECMAAKLPIVLAIDGEARRLVQQAKGGICVPPENVDAIADAIRRLTDDPELCRTLGKNARDYVLANYDRREIARRFAQLLPKNMRLNSIDHSSNDSK